MCRRSNVRAALPPLLVPPYVFGFPGEKRVLGDALGQSFVACDQTWLDLSVIEEAIEELPFPGRERDQRLQSFSALRDEFAGPRLGIAELARDLSAQRRDQLVFEFVRFVTDTVHGKGAPVLPAHRAVSDERSAETS